MPAHRSPALRRLGTVALLALATLVTLDVAPARADELADRVLGQLRFDLATPNLVDARGFFQPQGVAVDRSTTPHRVWVADTGNSRVLGWRDIGRFLRGAPADLVLGQPDPFTAVDPIDGCPLADVATALDRLCGPASLAVDGAGNLFVADVKHRRVLEFDDPFATDRVADRVYGPIFEPEIALDPAGNLYVVETFQGVFVYESPLADATPDRLIGSALSCAAASVPGALCAPFAVAVDAAGDLYVADGWVTHGYDGVWVFRQPLATDLEPDLLIDGFADGLDGIVRVEVDAAGALYVSAIGQQGLLVYEPPLAAGARPAFVLGQLGDGPGVAFAGDDLRGDLLVTGRNAVLVYSRPLAAGSTPDLVVGHMDPAGQGPNRVDRRGLFAPRAVAVDRSVTPNRLWVLDSGNSRVLGWRDAAGFANGAPADLVVGQPGPGSSACNAGGRGAASLCLSTLRGGGLAVDERGNLWVADGDNHRVLFYEAPFDTDAVADRVLGQRGSFGTGACNRGGVSARSLCHPGALALGPDGALWVADAGNDRVLAFRDPLAGDDLADRVLGQRDRFGSNACNLGGVTARSLCLHRVGDRFFDEGVVYSSTGLAIDGRGTVFVSDWLNSRVLAFDAPLATDTAADRLLGQRTLSANGDCGRAPKRLCGPAGLALDERGGLWIADEGNHRVLRVDARLGMRLPDRLLGGVAQPFELPERPSAKTLRSPAAVAVDEAGSIFVADTGDHRVLAFDEP